MALKRERERERSYVYMDVGATANFHRCLCANLLVFGHVWLAFFPRLCGQEDCNLSRSKDAVLHRWFWPFRCRIEQRNTTNMMFCLSCCEIHGEFQRFDVRPKKTWCRKQWGCVCGFQFSATAQPCGLAALATRRGQYYVFDENKGWWLPLDEVGYGTARGSRGEWNAEVEMMLLYVALSE